MRSLESPVSVRGSNILAKSLVLIAVCGALAACDGELFSGLLRREVGFSQAEQQVHEGAGQVIVHVALDLAATKPIAVPVTVSGTATPAVDYAPFASTAVHFDEGRNEAVIVFELIDDSLREAEESIVLTLGTPDGAVLAATSVHTVRIVDNDAPVAVSVSAAEAFEGDGNLTCVVALSGPSGVPVSVAFATRDATAHAGADYVHSEDVLTFAPGETSKNVVVALLDDDLNEDDEELVMELSAPTEATIAAGSARLTIRDDDPDLPAVSIADAVASEQDGAVDFVLSLSGPSGRAVTVDYASQDGTARTADLDYEASSGTVSFAAGVTTQTISITVLDDDLLEGSETFTVVLSSPTHATLGQASATATILDDEVVPQVSIADAAAPESEPAMELVISLSEASGLPVQVDYATADVTATAGQDYVMASGQVTFEPGVTTLSVLVELIDDDLDEGSETFSVTLANPVNAALGDAAGVGTILDTENIPSLTIADAAAAEQDGAVELRVRLSDASGRSVTVDFATEDGTAGVDDYVPAAGTLTFAPGEVEQAITVSLLDDSLLEGSEVFYVSLADPTLATIDVSRATATILDDEVLPGISVSDAAAAEQTGGMDFLVTLAEPSGLPVSVDFVTTDGTATSGEDYESLAATVTFDPGVESQVVRVTLLDDAILEGSETLSITISNPVHGTITRASGTGTILDDEVFPDITVADAAGVEEDGEATVVVSLSGATGMTVAVAFSTRDDTARAGVDYTGVDGSLSFAPGVTSMSVAVELLDDALVEGSETFFLNLFAPENAAIARPQAVVTILDGDVVPQISVADAMAAEGSGVMELTVSLSEASGQTVTVDFTTLDDTATVADGDYELATGTLSFAPGQTMGAVAVTLIQDMETEGSETLLLELSSPVHAIIGRGLAVGTILDGDTIPSIAISDGMASEQDGSVQLLVTLSEPSGLTVTIDFATADGTARAADNDYVALAGTITFDPGETTQSIDVVVLDDTLAEGSESFFVELASPVNATLAMSTGEAIILDTDVVPQLVISPGIASEADGAVELLVTLSEPVGLAVAVDFATADDTATVAQLDYTAVSGTLTFVPGTVQQVISVPIADDAVEEGTEQFWVDLSDSVNATIGVGRAAGVILDTDVTPTISVDDVTASEADGGATVTVSLSEQSGLTVTVRVTTVDGTATVSGLDYVGIDDVLTFSPGETSRTFDIVITDDGLYEGTEELTVELSEPTNATIATGLAVVTILDADAVPLVSVADASAAESAGSVQVDVTLSEQTGQTVQVSFATSDVTAADGLDYQARSGTLVFAPGETTKSVTLIVLPDALDEDDERLTLQLSGPTNAFIGTGLATVTIEDDDPLPMVAFASASQTQLESVGVINLTVSLSEESGRDVSIPFAADVASTAVSPDDYTMSASPLVIPAGSLSGTISVSVNPDALYENDEILIVHLVTPTHAELDAIDSHELTIANDDTPPTVQLASASQTRSEGAGDVLLSVVLSAPSGLPVVVPFSVDAGSLAIAADYTIDTSPLTIAPGAASGAIRITLTDDSIDELDETVIVDLGVPTNATAGATTRHVLTIADNDAAPTAAFVLASQDAAEAVGAVVVSVALSAVSGLDITVPFSVGHGSTAVPGAEADYTISASPILIPAGEAAGSFTITVNDDLLDETSEAVVVELDDPVNADLGAISTHTLTVLDNDDPPTVAFSQPAQSVSEGVAGGTAAFTFTLSSKSGLDVVVPFTVNAASTAGAPADYELAATSVTIAAGVQSQAASVTIFNDPLDENDETIIVDIDTPTNATVGAVASHTLIIEDDDSPPAVEFSTAAQTRSEGAGTVVITIALSTYSALDVTVPFSVSAASTADSPGDYTGLSSSPLVIAAGSLSRTISLDIVDDTLSGEGNETVMLVLGSPENATTGAVATHTLTITENDGVPTVSFSAAAQEQDEGVGTITLTVELSAASAQIVSVPFSVDATSTAAAADDYAIQASPLEIAAGSLSETITITVQEDTLDENDETVIVDLGTPANAGLGAITTHTVTITDNDAPPSVQLAATAQLQGEDVGTVVLTLELSTASGLPVSVPFSVDSTSTAAAPDDFTISASPAVIAAGSVTQIITITVLDDLLDEAEETVVVGLGTPVNAALGTNVTHTLSITDNDDAPVVQFATVSHSQAEGAGSITCTVALSGASGLDVEVPFTVRAASTATDQDDYTIQASPLSINAGATSATIGITIVDDLLDENAETVVAELLAPANATLGANTIHTLTITDNDPTPTVQFATAAQSQDEDAGDIVVTLSLSAVSGRDITLPFSADATSTARDPEDYTLQASPVVIAAGAMSQTITISVDADLLDEDDETVIVNLGTPVNADPGGTLTHTATITDDDPLPVVQFSTTAQSLVENDAAGAMTVAVELSAVSGRPVSAAFSPAVASTATLGGDYALSPSPVTFAPGTTSATITITVSDDIANEGDETVVLELGALANATSGANTVHTATIVDNDIPATLLSAETMDADADGRLDHYVLTFSQAVDDSSFPGFVGDGVPGAPQAQWTILGYSDLVIVTGASAPVGDTSDDEVIYLRFTEMGFDTGATPDVRTTATPGLMTLGGPPLAQITSATVTEEDGAAPVIVRVSSETGLTHLNVFLSEPVVGSGAGGTIDVAAGDLSYADLSVSGVADIVDGADVDGTDGVVRPDTFAAVAVTGGDMYRDRVQADGARVTDLAGNAASATSRLVTGIIHPYVLSAVSVDAFTARLTYSEPMDNAAATTLANYAYTDNAAPVCGVAPSISAITKVSDAVYDFTTSTQATGCVYRIAAVGPVLDQDEAAALVDPKFATFLGDESLKVLSAHALSLRSFVIVFSKPVAATGGLGGAGNLGYYTLPPALGSVLAAARYDAATGDPADANKVQITHSLDQGRAFYSVIVSTLLEDATRSENLSPEPLDRTTFQGIAGAVTKLEEGAMFSDPFGDGTTFSFVFVFGGRVYAGPNDNNDAVFRFDADGSNAVTVTFINDSGTSGAPFSSFGSNVSRPSTAGNPAGTTTRHQLPPGTDLSSFAPGHWLSASGCAQGGNNRAARVLTVVNDAGDYVDFNDGVPPVLPDSACDVLIYNGKGPDSYDGVDAFVSATVGGLEYLVFGGHNIGGGGFGEIHFTRDLDQVLDNDYCDIGGVTLGNSESLQTIYGYGDKLYFGFGSNVSRMPLFAHMDMSVTGGNCGALTDVIKVGGGQNSRANGLDYLGKGGTPGNSAPSVGIDSVVAFDDGNGVALYVANNGGIAATAAIPPDNAAVWADMRHDFRTGDPNPANQWDGFSTTREIPNIGKLRPGEKGIPFMTEWDGYLFVARNRDDDVAEVWKYDAAGGWAVLARTSDITNGMNPNNQTVSLLTVSGERLYIGFDNDVDGAEVWRTRAGVTASSSAGHADLEQVGLSGFGPVGAPDLHRNKHIISNATILHGGSYYLYVTIGCTTDFHDNGACDRNTALGATDFAIRMFRQVD